MQVPVLSDPGVYPDDEVLATFLGETFSVYQLFKSRGLDAGLETQWKYYQDGKSWLCKMSFKKKTILWLSIWNQQFKTGFYFTDKTKEAVLNLSIDKKIKQAFANRDYIGKLIPLTIEVSQKGQLDDLFTIIEYKKSLK